MLELFLEIIDSYIKEAKNDSLATIPKLKRKINKSIHLEEFL